MAVTASDLRCRITIHRGTERVNDLEETGVDYRPERAVWANLVPLSGRTAAVEGGMERGEITHRATLRASSCPVIDRGMYFTFRGQRYDVLFGYPIYNRSGWLELFCRLVVEDNVKSD